MSNYCLLFVLLIGPAFAVQQSGTVRSGEQAIPGATVTATKGEQKVVTTTDDSGGYVFADLPAGAWTLQVDMFGFKAAKRDVTVEDRAAAIEWTLELKPVSEAPISAAKPVAARPRGAGLAAGEAGPAEARMPVLPGG